MKNNRLYRMLLSRTAALPTNGKQNGKVERQTVAANGQRAKLRLRPRNFRGLGATNSSAWRQDPLRTFNKGLFALSILLTLAIPALMLRDARALRAKVSEPAPQTQSGKSSTKRIAPSGGAFVQIAAQRPYFRRADATEKSISVEPIDAADVPGLAQRYELIGVLMGESPRAIVRARNTDSSQFLAKGDRLEGYTVQEIFSDRILLELDGDLVNLRM